MEELSDSAMNTKIKDRRVPNYPNFNSTARRGISIVNAAAIINMTRLSLILHFTIMDN